MVSAEDTFIARVADKVASDVRLSPEEGLQLLQHPRLSDVASLADAARRQKHPDGIVTYIVDRNINPTNICIARCSFCAFDRLPGDPEGYVLTHEEIFQKIDELLALGGVQILMQGGHHPRLGVEYYEELIRAIKDRFEIHVHALSPSEVVHISRVSKTTWVEAIQRLMDAGLDSIPGGGGEILVDRVRKEIAPHKANTEQWLGVMREAHQLGLKTTATMMFGHVETPEERIEHLLRIRELQDETDGFTAFIGWTFQPGGSELDVPKSGATDFLRTLAVSRLMLDNVPNLQTSFITQGPKVAQLGLIHGANDFGNVFVEENVVSSAGTEFLMSIASIEQSIMDAGFTPQRRNMFYQRLGEPGPTVAEESTPC